MQRHCYLTFQCSVKRLLFPVIASACERLYPVCLIVSCLLDARDLL
jgi:hypothetical protein